MCQGLIDDDNDDDDYYDSGDDGDDDDDSGLFVSLYSSFMHTWGTTQAAEQHQW